ncbi:TonB-dependent receptor [Thalassotalea crassostreae]|uniref:TonB-dependent receptor n=1 Tax=Thalassotalea crassostreae TaxID=1763536 RepID=UPI0008382328|nr:TonB-dependent receptor [Thalassotalea crassostreae]
MTFHRNQSRTHFKHSVLAQTIAAAITLSSYSAIAAEQEVSDEQADIDDVIVVTAQKREQNVMKTPVTVDTVSAETIKESGSILLSEIDKFIPGFDFSDGNMTQAGVTIRGVSSPGITVGGDPSSATFFDGVYMPRAAQNVLFSDMQRVEVLKGPQGTLFGKNAAMGVVSMVPNAPNEDFEGFVKGTVGTDNLQRIEGMINFSLTDNVYLRANLLTNTRDGYIDNITRAEWNEGTKVWDLGAQDHNAARIAIKWDISDRTNLQLSYDVDDLEQAPPMAVGYSEWAYKMGQDPFGDKQENDVRHGVESRDMYAVTLKLNHEFNDQWSMMFVSSFRDWDTINREDEDGTADPTRYLDTSNNEDSNIHYNELQVNYNSDKINFVGGITYSKEEVWQETEINFTTDTVARLVTGDLNSGIKAMVGEETFEALGMEMDHIWNADEWQHTMTILGFPPEVFAWGDTSYKLAASPLVFNEPLVFGPSYAGEFWSENFYNTGEFTSYGVYADLDYQITDKWNVFGGLRYSEDEKEFSWEVTQTPFAEQVQGVSNLFFPPREKYTTSKTWDKVTGRIGTGYIINDDHMVFASFATGYKAGGFDSLNSPHDNNPFSPTAGELIIDPATGEVRDVSFDPEESQNLELGYKGILFDSLRTTVALYHTILDDMQTSRESMPPGQVAPLPTVVNQDVTIDGIELSLIWEATDTITAGIVTDYRESDTETASYYNSIGELIPETSTTGESLTSYTVTFDWLPDIGLGNTKLHMDYVFVENGRKFEVGTPEWEKNLPNYLDDRQDLNARASWVNESDNLEVGIWGKNLLDNRYVESAGGRTVEFFGTAFGRVNRGIEAGVDVKYSF